MTRPQRKVKIPADVSIQRALCFHALNRGGNRGPLFSDDADREYLKGLIGTKAFATTWKMERYRGAMKTQKVQTRRYVAARAGRIEGCEAWWDHPLWSRTPVGRDFVRVCNGRGRATNRTSLSVLYSRTGLLVKVNCDVAPEYGGVKGADGDTVEIFLDIPGTKNAYCRFVATPRGLDGDGTGTLLSSSVQPEWECLVRHAKASWSLLGYIPASSLKRTPRKGETWRLNVFRTVSVRKKTEYGGWSDTRGPYNKPERFGYLLFSSDGREQKGRLSFAKKPYVVSPGCDQVTLLWEMNRKSHCEVAVRKGRTEIDRIRSHGAAQLHRHVLTGLLPGTRYSYSVTAQSGHVHAAGSFVTASEEQKSFSFAVVGDSQTPAIFRSLMRRLCQENVEKPEFLIHLGDFSNVGSSNRLMELEFFEAAEAVLKRAAIYPVIGNHDCDLALFRTLFPPPSGKLYYSFDWGPAHFTVLYLFNSRFCPGSPQYAWLVKDLSTADRTWKLLCTHPPLRSLTSEGNAYCLTQRRMRRIIEPVLREHGVDLVLSGHEHSYQHVRHKGISYVTSAGGTISFPFLLREFTKLTGHCRLVTEPHYCLITVSRDRLLLRAKDMHGEVIDQVLIEGDGQPE